ncbi:hypothetical protein COH32_05520 [Neisseria meningitidis]|nr:hypothetical protein COI07_03860 [Neisseria meningitidis]RQL23489.1 hypothetical protein COH31_06570 [Neisseria meningitidis]RQL30657.1 hypothetical protein COH32_05520 [Neisseria meningitidis]RQL36669.1 hypothetical protein COH28_06625 [Neisseria meningitidis]
MQTLSERINPDSRPLRHSRRARRFPAHFVIPAKAGIRCVGFQSFPINSCRIVFLDSRFRGNDGGWVSVPWCPDSRRYGNDGSASLT